MSAPVRAFSAFVVARWAYAGAGSSIDMNARLAGDPPAAAKYDHSFFALDPALAILAMMAFVAAGLGVAGWLLRRRSRVG